MNETSTIVPGTDAPAATEQAAFRKDRSAISAVIARLESATAGSHELDARIWAALNDREYDGEYVWEGPSGKLYQHHWTVPAYTTSIDAALTLVQPPHYLLMLGQITPTIWVAEIGNASDDRARSAGESRIAALALCIAELKARVSLATESHKTGSHPNTAAEPVQE